MANWLASDSGTETTTQAKLFMNLGYKQILARFRRDQNIDRMTASTVAAQRGYILPPNFLRIKSVTFTYGGILTVVEHVQSEDVWHPYTEYDQTQARPERFFINNRFGVGGAEILLDPIPSVVGTLQVIYEATDRDLNVTKYTTGTITLANGSAAVTGAGTTFTNAMVGRYLQATAADGDGLWYRISSYSSATSITLDTAYEGAAYNGTYQIAEAFALPEEMQILPVYYFAQHYWSKKRNKDKIAEFAGLYRAGIDQGQMDYNSKDDSAKVFNSAKYKSGYPLATPQHFPQSVS